MISLKIVVNVKTVQWYQNFYRHAIPSKVGDLERRFSEWNGRLVRSQEAQVPIAVEFDNDADATAFLLRWSQ